MTYINTAGSGLDYSLAGAVRVDGTLSTSLASPLGANADMYIYYDDEINHSILVTPLQLQVDSVQHISAT